MEFNQINSISDNSTICAVASPAGRGGIAVIRLSGPDSLSIVEKAFSGAHKLSKNPRNAVYGEYSSIGNEILDDMVAIYFKSPHSFTGEDTVELSLHGSTWIQREVLNDLVKRGARIAGPGEFTRRAFVNGKMDLTGAEGVADLIAADSKKAHDIALSQLKGSFARELEKLREQLVEFASLLELELDFSEEDVEFADREKLLNLCELIISKIKRLADSFAKGKVLKEGVTVAIVGLPNVGKSSLLNLLCKDEKAIVTEIPGTTRDLIEETVEIDGVLYRFIDTAGLRESSDPVENIGVSRAREVIGKANIVIWMIDSTSKDSKQFEELDNFLSKYPDKHLIILENKSDIKGDSIHDKEIEYTGIIPFSTFTEEGLQDLYNRLTSFTNTELSEDNFIVTNARHYEALIKSLDSLRRVAEGLSTGLSADFIAQDIRETLHHLGTITGAVTTDDLLHTIFSRFCIGK